MPPATAPPRDRPRCGASALRLARRKLDPALRAGRAQRLHEVQRAYRVQGVQTPHGGVGGAERALQLALRGQGALEGALRGQHAVDRALKRGLNIGVDHDNPPCVGDRTPRGSRCSLASGLVEDEQSTGP